MTKFTLVPTLTALLVAFSGSAQDADAPCNSSELSVADANTLEQVHHLSSFVPAKPIERANPRFPVMAAKIGAEGWVKMSYVIDEEGNVVDPVIEDAGGSRYFRNPALNAIKKWKYEPAMIDGKPTQQCRQSIQMDFVLEGKTGAARSFVRKYKEIDQLMQEGDLVLAQEGLAELHERDTNNRYENAWLWSLDAQVAGKLQDYRRELASWNRAVASSSRHSSEYATFKDDFMAQIYSRQFQINAYFGYYVEALEAAESLESITSQSQVYQGVADSVERVKAFIASDEHIQVAMDLSGRTTQFHSLSRQQFLFDNIQGQLNTVEVRCDSHREKYTVAENHLWTIPDSWGQCRVLVEGTEGTQFRFLK